MSAVQTPAFDTVERWSCCGKAVDSLADHCMSCHRPVPMGYETCPSARCRKAAEAEQTPASSAVPAPSGKGSSNTVGQVDTDE